MTTLALARLTMTAWQAWTGRHAAIANRALSYVSLFR